MRKLDSMEDEMRGIVTYELDDGSRVVLDAKAVSLYGAAEVLRGCGIEIETKRLPVFQSGECIGMLASDFDPAFASSKSPLYDFRPGDLVCDGTRWAVSPSLGYGDLLAVPGLILH